MTGLKKIFIIFVVAIVLAGVCNTYRVAAYEPTLEEISAKIKELYPVMETTYATHLLTVKVGQTTVEYMQVKRVLFAENLKTNQELATASALINAVADLQGLSAEERKEASSKFSSVDSLKGLTYTVDKNGVEINETSDGVFSIKINMDKHFTEKAEENSNNNVNTNNTTTNTSTNTNTNTNTGKTNTTTNTNKNTSTSTTTGSTTNVVNTVDDTYAKKAIPKTGSNFVAKRVCLGILFASTATLIFIIMYNERIGMNDGTK